MPANKSVILLESLIEREKATARRMGAESFLISSPSTSVAIRLESPFQQPVILTASSRLSSLSASEICL